jgi:ribonucleotide reductase alpha subunit
MVDIGEDDKASINFDRLRSVVNQLVHQPEQDHRPQLPYQETETSNLKHHLWCRSSGLADVLPPWVSALTARSPFEIEREMFRVIYHTAMSTSIDLAVKFGKYESFEGSPLFGRILQPNLWLNSDIERLYPAHPPTGDLRTRVKTHGAQFFSWLLMPPLLPPIFLGAGRAMEPYSALHTRKTLAGEFIVVNKKLVEMLERKDYGTKSQEGDYHQRGSIKGIDLIPSNSKLFQTVWDLKQKILLQHARTRAPYVCRSQSMNIFMEAPTRGKVKAMLMWGWNAGLKTAYTTTSVVEARLRRNSLQSSRRI